MIDFNVEKQNQILQFLKERRIEKDLKLKDIANKLDISVSYLKKLEDGEYKKTNLELLLNYYTLLDLEPEKLLLDLNFFKNKNNFDDRIPVYGDIDAENTINTIDYLFTIKGRKLFKNLFGYQINEDFLYGEFKKGDILIIDKFDGIYEDILKQKVIYKDIEENEIAIGNFRYQPADELSGKMYNVYNDKESKSALIEYFPESIKIYGTIEGFVRLV